MKNGLELFDIGVLKYLGQCCKEIYNVLDHYLTCLWNRAANPLPMPDLKDVEVEPICARAILKPKKNSNIG